MIPTGDRWWPDVGARYSIVSGVMEESRLMATWIDVRNYRIDRYTTLEMQLKPASAL